MSDERECGLIIVAGKKGVGKTVRTCSEIDSYTMNDPSIGRFGRKVLIFDVNNEPDYRKYRTIDFDVDEPDDFKRGFWIRKFAESSNVEARRIIPIKKNNQPFSYIDFITTIQTIATNFKKGLFVAEDINRYVDHKNQDFILGMLITLRHKNLDMIIHLQSLSKVTTTMWENTNYLRLHKTSDNIDRYLDRIPNFTIIKMANIIVSKRYSDGDIYSPVFCSPTDEEFFNITKEEFEYACNQYTLLYDKEIKGIMKDEKNGKKLYPDRETAVKKWMQDKSYMIKRC